MYSLLISTLITSSCSKVENIAPPPCIEKEEMQDSTSKVIGNPFFSNPHGEAYCTKVNQLTWFEPYIGKYEKTFFYLRLIGLDSNKIASDEFVIYNIPLNIGCYKIEANSVDPNTKLVEAYYRNIAFLNY